MTDCVSIKKKGFRFGISAKLILSAVIIALAAVLPQIVHAFAGSVGGARWLPMYLPVLLGGCLLGRAWGLGIGVLSPLVSFAVTSIFGDPMPAASRLPFMTAELAVFAVVSGAFSERIARDGRFAFPAVIVAELCGRTAYILLALIFQSVTPVSLSVVWAQIQSGFAAMALQALLVPAAVIGLRLLLVKERRDD